MGFLDRIFGTESTRGEKHQSEDERALARYRYMIQTAPPETVEQAHAEAFAKLGPEQRRMVLSELANAAPPAERSHAQSVSPDDPRAMARLATRAEVRQPGFMERTLSGGGGPGLGTNLLGSFAAGFVGSMVAQSFFSALGGFGSDSESAFAADEAAVDGNPELADTGFADTGSDDGDFDDGGFEV